MLLWQILSFRKVQSPLKFGQRFITKKNLNGEPLGRDVTFPRSHFGRTREAPSRHLKNFSDLISRGSQMITGRCECKRVGFQIDGKINDYSHCHCSQCRRLHGAAFASFGGVERTAFSYISGESEVSYYSSSDSHQRLFCKHCGSNILVALTSEPDALYVAMGVIDGNPPLPPAYHIFLGSKAPWYGLDNTGDQYDTFPNEPV